VQTSSGGKRKPDPMEPEAMISVMDEKDESNKPSPPPVFAWKLQNVL
jgi:hypothetical protein